MVTVRTAKAKGSNMEYSIRDSLLPIMPDILLTKELGFVQGYDLISREHKKVFESKRHASFTWNELSGYFEKLERNAPQGYIPYLVFKGNHQPALVMRRGMFKDSLIVGEFESFFGIKFVKHVGRGGNDEFGNIEDKDVV